MLNLLLKLRAGLLPLNCRICKEELEVEYLKTNLNILCQNCRLNLLNQTGLKLYQNSYYLWPYEDEIESLIKKFKFSKQYRLSKLFAEFVFIALRNYNIYNSSHIFNCDLACAVPSTSNSIRSKRFYHSEMLAKAVSKRLEIKFSEHAIRCSRERDSQVSLNKKQRKTNVKNAFYAEIKIVKNKTVLLIDDILTTGATMEECCQTLYKAGAKKVFSLALAKRELYDF